MARRIDYYFSPMSGFAYLGHEALAALACRHGAIVVPRPVDIGAVFRSVGVLAPSHQHPARLAYREADMRRWADLRGLPLVAKPAHWPTNATLAALCVVAAEQRGEDAMRLAGALLAAVWARELDIADRVTLARIVAETGLDAPALLDAAAGAPARARYDANTAEAIEHGAPGSPTMVVGGTMIFGQDRLHFVEQALTAPSPPSGASPVAGISEGHPHEA